MAAPRLTTQRSHQVHMEQSHTPAEENEAGQRDNWEPALKKGTRDRSTQLLVVGLLLAVIGSYLVAYIYG